MKKCKSQKSFYIKQLLNKPNKIKIPPPQRKIIKMVNRPLTQKKIILEVPHQIWYFHQYHTDRYLICCFILAQTIVYTLFNNN